MVDQLVTRFLRSDWEAKKEKKDKLIPSHEELLERNRLWERAYLINEENLDILATWYSAGKQPPTLLEVSQWPAHLRHDYTVLMSRLGERREVNEDGEGWEDDD